MSLHVEGKMVRSGEGSLAQAAVEGPVPCVLAEVAGQLIRPGKLPATALPRAQVWLLTSVGP